MIESWSARVSIRSPRALFFTLTVAGFLMWVALSDERTCLSFIIAFGPRHSSDSRVLVMQNLWLYFTASHLKFPQPGKSGPLISPRNRWPNHWGPLFLISYDS
jgi:hypothetical protein